MKTQVLLLIVLAINSFHSANIECQMCKLDDKALNSVTTDSCPHNFNEYCQIFAKTCANQIQKCFPKLTKSINMFKDWPRSQVFIYYDYWRFLEDKLDCLGTILTRRYILTAATCVLNSDVSLKDAVVYHDKENYDIEKYTVPTGFCLLPPPGPAIPVIEAHI